MLTFRNLSIFAILTATVLAGCSGSAGNDDEAEVPGGGTAPPSVEVTETTGGIRGIVVDASITPVADAAIRLSGGGANKETTTNAEGTFTISGLEAGTYFLEATHPLYDKVQQTATVVAGDKNPDIVKIQLNRVIFIDPYMYTLKEEGYIVCSANVVGGWSEECGEGVGFPCDPPTPYSCQRIGGQDNNRPEIDFYITDPNVKTVIIEQVWEPSTQYGPPGSALGEFWTNVNIGYICDPLCGGTGLLEMRGESPLYGRLNVTNMSVQRDNGDWVEITNETRMSTFTYANSDDVTGFGTPGPTVLLEQEYTVFLTYFYALPAPMGWSFVNGDPDPYKT